MSDFRIDEIGKLNDFATMIATLMGVYFGADPSNQGGTSPSSQGGTSGSQGQLIDDVLIPDPNKLLPNIGQLSESADISQFGDAIDLFDSYNKARRALVGNPGEYLASPTSSSLAAFYDGLNHLYGTAITLYKNYGKAGNDDEFSAEQVRAMLDAPPSTQQPPPAS